MYSLSTQIMAARSSLYSFPFLSFSLPKIYCNREKEASPPFYFSFNILQKTTALFCQYSSLCSRPFQAVTLEEMPLYLKK